MSTQFTINNTELQTALSNKADLLGGVISSTQLPSYIDDVLEFVNLASFPITGVDGKIYVATDTNLIYRWTGTLYVNISQSLALGETLSTAYRGDRGKIAYDHSQITGNPHGLTKTDLGLENVDNTSDLNKPISTATQTALNEKASLTGATFTGNITANQLATNSQTFAPTGTTQAINWNSGSVINLSLASASGNVTLTLNNPTITSYLIVVTQGATPRNLIFPAGTIQLGGGGNTYIGIANQKDLLSLLWTGTEYILSVSRIIS